MDEIFKRLRQDKFPLIYGNFGLNTAIVHVYAAASFSNNRDLSSQLVYVMLVADEKSIFSFISCSSTKSQRVTRCCLAAEIYTIALALDAGFVFKHTFLVLLNQKIDIQIYTHSQTLLDSITSFCSMAEKRLIIGIYCLREAYRAGERFVLGCIRTNHNLSDALMKDQRHWSLHESLRTHRAITPVQQYVDECKLLPRL